MNGYLPLTVPEMATLNDSLRVMELSLLWYGTRDRSPERLCGFVAAEGRPIIQNALATVAARLEAKDTPARTGSGCWTTHAKRVLFQLLGLYPGRAWIPTETLRDIRAVSQDFLHLTANAAIPNGEQLAALKGRISSLHAELSAVVPAGSPRSALRFFGCEAYGKADPGLPAGTPSAP